KPLFIVENGFGAYDKVEEDGSIKRRLNATGIKSYSKMITHL
ncbi:hypothetical protein EC971742_0361, partial [Escherichia coli 97.1742]